MTFEIELVRDEDFVVETTVVSSVDEAQELLQRETVNGFWRRLCPPDKTGNLPGDDARYDRQYQLLGIENAYA